MSVQSHLHELERRHKAIERELEAAIQQPATPDAHLAELKRKKLYLKDQITRIRETATSTSLH